MPAARAKSYAVRVADGGRLVTSLSLENVGEADFSRILNFRRFNDSLIRREGWILFKPDPLGADTQAVFDGAETLLRLAECVRPNGTRVTVGASRTLIKKFDTATGLWTDIRGGLTFSASGKRWQANTLNGYLILNNTVDALVSYRVEDAAVTPIYELRQVGIASVGRIQQYNGFLCLADITEIKADQLDAWMNGYASYTATSTVAKNADFSVVFGTDHQKQFDVTTGAATITVTLPVLTFSDVPLYFWLKKADAGVGTVVTTPLIADQAVVLTTQNDLALVFWNGMRWVATLFPLGTIPAFLPYGAVPAGITQRIPYEWVNGEFGEPTKWAPLFDSTMAAASTQIVLPFVPSTWVAGQTRVGVINGGPSGDTLGGQTGYEEGILVTVIGAFTAALGGVPITLEKTTDVGLTYPRTVQVTRFGDLSTIVSRYLLQDDGSAIIGMEVLGEQLVLARTTGFYVGRYTGDVDNPFVFRPRYAGSNVPKWGDCIANINGDYLLYPSIEGRFYKFDGVSYPVVHKVCDDAGELFFTGVLQSDECFVVNNPQTREAWFCRPDLTFAYDYETNTVSEIDSVIDAAAYVMQPGATDQWFILGIAGDVFTYGLVDGVVPIKTWLRDTVVPTAKLTSGLISGYGLVAGGLMTEEKTLLSYTPVLSSSSDDVAVTVQLRTTHNPSATLTDLLVPVESLPTPEGENYFTTAFSAIFFQDEIVLVDTRDVDLRISHRIFELDRLGEARGVTRAVGYT